MPDPAGLRFIGIGFSAITAVVAFIAAVTVVGTSPDLSDNRPAIATIGTR
jgi:hypothetical protein